jgi:GTP pyrophosphokinase
MKDEDVVFKASEYAARAHVGQMRKDGETPYIVHPARVAMTVAITMFDCPTLDNYSRSEMVAAAWLHDVVEDTDRTFEDLSTTFPEKVVELVRHLTNDKALKQRHCRSDRKMLDRIRLIGAPQPARFIKLADRLDNVRDIDNLPKGFRQVYAHESYFLIQGLLDQSMISAGRYIAYSIIDQIQPHLAPKMFSAVREYTEDGAPVGDTVLVCDYCKKRFSKWRYVSLAVGSIECPECKRVGIVR